MFIGLCLPVVFSLDRIAGAGSIYPYYFGLSIFTEVAILSYFAMRLLRTSNSWNHFVAVVLLMAIPVVLIPCFSNSGSSLLTIWGLATFATIFPALPLMLLPAPLLLIPVIAFMMLLISPYRKNLYSKPIQVIFIIYLILVIFFVHAWGSSYWRFVRADTLRTERNVYYADFRYYPLSDTSTVLFVRECSLQGWACKDVFSEGSYWDKFQTRIQFSAESGLITVSVRDNILLEYKPGSH
jgi:hypothetical protein